MTAVTDRAVHILLDGTPGWTRTRDQDLQVWWSGHGAAQGVTIRAAADALLLARSLSEVGDVEQKRELMGVDGHFALVIRSPRGVFLATDRVGSIPLLIGENGLRIAVGTNIHIVRRQLGLAAHDPVGVLQYAMAGYTLDDRTIYRGLHILRPGEWCHIAPDGTVRQGRWYRYQPWRIDAAADAAEWRRRLIACNDALFAKLVRSLNGRPVMLPLSGGFDSRLVASGLRRHGYRAVTCFSYGHAGNFEAGAAKQVAEKLGYSWHFVEHDSRLVQQTLASEDFRSYVEASDNGGALPFFQDFAAITALRRQSLVPDGAIFINGNSGDFISGNHVPTKVYDAPALASWEGRVERVVADFSAKHFSLWRDLRSPANVAAIGAELTRLVARDVPAPLPEIFDYAMWESLEFDARQSRFVINGQRIYEHFGHGWRLPLWDNDYLNFWQVVPPSQKREQKLYRDTLLEADWGGVWQSIPLNPQKRWRLPPAAMALRLLAKALLAPMPRSIWKEFDRRVFSYWTGILGTSAVRPYRDLLFDRHGARGPNSFRSLDLLSGHGVAVDNLWTN